MTNPATSCGATVDYPSSQTSSAIPNIDGTLILYCSSTFSPKAVTQSTEIRISNLVTGTSILISIEPEDKEPKWLGVGNQIIWMRDADFGGTEFWIADVGDEGFSKHRAGRIRARASTFKLQSLNDRYGDIAVAIPCLLPPSPAQNTPLTPSTSQESHPPLPRRTMFYLTLRKKAMDNTLTNLKYIISPTRPMDILRNTDLQLEAFPAGDPNDDFDISPTGITFLVKGQGGGSSDAVLYHVPLTSLTYRPVIKNLLPLDPRLGLLRTKGLSEITKSLEEVR